LLTAASCVSAASAYFPAGRSRLTTSRIKPSPAPGGELVLFPRGREQAMQFRRRLGVHGVVQHPSGRVLELPRRGVLGRRPFFAAWLPLANRATARLCVLPDGGRFDVSGLPRSRPPVGLGSWRSARTRRIRPETRRSCGLPGCIEGSGWFTSRRMPRRLTCILCDAIGTQTQGRILRGLEAVVAALTTVPAPEIPCSR